MKMTYTGMNTNKLHDELIEAGIVPSLVESRDCITWITFKDDTNEATIAAVVAKHNPTPRVVVNPDAELAAAIMASNTLPELKAALLGLTKAGKIKAQSTN